MEWVGYPFVTATAKATHLIALHFAVAIAIDAPSMNTCKDAIAVAVAVTQCERTFSEVDTNYTWQQIKMLIRDCVFPWCEKFGTWSSNRKEVDQVPNRKVSTQKEESSVLGPQRARKRGPSPEQ